MKKIKVAILLVMLASCAAPIYIMGMSEQSFVDQNNRLKPVYQTSEISVYKRMEYPFGKPPVTRFFYFKNHELVAMDEGQKAADIVIKVQNN